MESAKGISGNQQNVAVLGRQVAALAECFYAVQAGLQNGDDFYRQSRAEIISGYHRPLILLLEHWLCSGDRAARAIYLNELSRYLPKLLESGSRQRYFLELTAGFSEQLRALLPDAAMHQLAALHAELTDISAAAPLSVVTVGDCLMTELRVFLRQALNDAGIPHQLHSLYFSADQGVNLSTASLKAALTEQRADLLALSFLTYDGLPLYRLLKAENGRLSPQALAQRVADMIGVMEEYIQEIRVVSNVTIVLHNVSGLPLSHWHKRFPLLPPFSRRETGLINLLNQEIVALVDRVGNCLLLDERAVLERVGVRAALAPAVPARVSRGAMFHTSRFGYYLSEAYSVYVRAYERLKGTKLLALDFDNTLWRGVMADGPVEQFHQRQALLKRLKDAGILLAAVSKNSADNIRWQEMTLQPEDFVSLKINWNLKPQSIAELAQELNLGRDAFIFIDDNPVERELVASQHGMVRCMDPEEPGLWSMLELMFQFPCTHDTEEARQRTEMYRTQAARHNSMAAHGGSYAAMMQALDLQLDFRLAQKSDLGRLYELVGRTNQFNTTTIRYRKDELQGMMGDDRYGVYVGELADKFGKLGVVVIAIVERGEHRLAIDSFVMSCRAMGFGLEKVFLTEVLAAEGWPGPVSGRFVPSAKNEPAATLYPEMGFVSLDGGWQLARVADLAVAPGWFSIRHQQRRPAA